MKETYKKYLTEATDNEAKAMNDMLSFLKDMKNRISKAEKAIKAKNIDLNVVDAVMRMSKITDESFFDYFWS